MLPRKSGHPTRSREAPEGRWSDEQVPRSVSEVADGLGINRSLLTRWKTELKAEGSQAFRGNGVVSAADDEMRQLRRKLAIAEQERDILKKALAYFAKDKN